jgi:hypothetical protein
MGDRAEDAEFLENMPAVIGSRALRALDEIQRTLALDSPESISA